MKKKVLGLGLGIMMAAVAFGGCSSSKAATEMVTSESSATFDATEASSEKVKDYGTTVTEMDANGTKLLVYYPSPNSAETMTVKTTCTAPVFMVFGNQVFTDTDAVQYAQSSGLAELAAENGSSVVFVNPQNGSSWSEADAGIYATVAQMVSDSSTDPVTNGIVESTNFMTKEKTTAISGTQQRIYVYAKGTGADFVAANILKKIEAQTSWGGTMNVTPAGCTLENLTTLASVEKSDIPVVSIGNADDINTKLKESCGSLTTEKTADFTSEFTKVISQSRRQAGVLLPIHDFEAEGIVQKVESVTVKTTADNASDLYKGSAEHVINYVTYYAKDLDVSSGKVPLVLCFHGGGNTALYEAQATEWPLIGKEHKFMTVSVDLHYPNCTAGEIVELIDQLSKEYSIDSTRIYASGFSMGGVKSWDLFEQYPTVFAGLAPMDASAEPGTDSYGNAVSKVNDSVIVPVFYVAGETSPLPEMPSQDEKLVKRVKNTFAVNQVKDPYDVSFADKDNWVNKIWGINGDKTYQVTDKTVFKDSTLTVNLFQSKDGKYYTAFTSSSNQSHEVYARNSWAAWDFLSQFSRNSDGTISVSPVKYSLASDDGSISDNSYNQ